MSPWPSPLSGALLTIGAAPLLFVVWRCFLAKRSEGLTLRFWSVVLPWTAFHASPFFAYFFGLEWNGSDCPIFHENVDTCLAFSAAAMGLTVLGYGLGAEPADRGRHAALMRLRTPAAGIALMTGAMLAAFVVKANGFGELWVSSEGRGEFQWMEVDLWWRIRHLAQIVCMVSAPAVAVLAALCAVNAAPRERTGTWCFVALVLLLLMLPGAHEFSRITGLPMIIAGAVVLNVNRGRTSRLGLASVAGGVFLCLVALSQRPSHDPGLGNFLDAATKGIDFAGNAGNGVFDLGVVNPVRSIERFTVAVEAREQAGERRLEDAAQFLTNIQPLPSVLAPVRQVVQPLAEYLGYSDNTCLPTPFFAELYYVFGYAGALLLAPVGWAYRWFDRRMRASPGVASSVAHFLCVASIGAATHDTARPLSRFLLYGLVVVALDAWRRHAAHDSAPRRLTTLAPRALTPRTRPAGTQSPRRPDSPSRFRPNPRSP